MDFAKSKIHRRKAKNWDFPLGNPKNCVFRRAINDRPYILKKTGFLDSLKKALAKASAFFSGGLEGIRTLDPHNANVVRSQLRYKPVYRNIILPGKNVVKGAKVY